MKFMEDQRSKGTVDEFQLFLEQESKKRQFQRLAFNLTDICWQLCIETRGSILESNIKSCLVNCVDRFIDINHFITYRFGNKFLNEPTEVDMQ